MGYHRAGFDVVGVDIAPQPHYPFAFVQADALEFCRDHGHEFGAIHASPPCQAYIIGLGMMNRTSGKQHPSLIEPTRDALRWSGRPYVIENVVGAPLLGPITLCGSSFRLRVRRHRLFESNVLLLSPGCYHRGQGRTVGVYGNKGNGGLEPNPRGGWFHRARSAEDAGDAMGIDWMEWRELTQAIPPAYTELIGRQLLRAVSLVEVA